MRIQEHRMKDGYRELPDWQGVRHKSGTSEFEVGLVSQLGIQVYSAVVN
jgi:hypothetical protein